MKKTLALFLFLSAQNFLYAQQPAKKPQYVIIAGDEIITMDKVNQLQADGYLKAMAKGVSEDERKKLVEKFGDKIGEKEFIVLISLFTEAEREERKKQKPATEGNDEKSIEATIKKSYLLNVNDQANDFSLNMIDGKKIQLSELKGNVVMINFWATWCAPCIMEFYDFPSKIIAPFKNEAFVLLPISIGEPQKTVADKMKKLKKDGITFNVGLDPNSSIFNQYATGGIPKSFLVDKKGIVRYVSTGNSEEGLAKIADTIKQLLAE